MSRTAGLLVATVFSLLAGCAGDAFVPPTASTPSDATRAGGSAPDASAPDAAATRLTRAFSGTIVWRVGGDEPPRAAHLGDPPTFCVVVPNGTRLLRGTLTWDVPEPMGLEFHSLGEGGSHRSYDDAVSSFESSSPIVLELADPVAGEWFIYAGPSVAGANIPWRLEMAWVGETAITLEQTTYSGPPCT